MRCSGDTDKNRPTCNQASQVCGHGGLGLELEVGVCGLSMWALGSSGLSFRLVLKVPDIGTPLSLRLSAVQR